MLTPQSVRPLWVTRSCRDLCDHFSRLFPLKSEDCVSKNYIMDHACFKHVESFFFPHPPNPIASLSEVVCRSSSIFQLHLTVSQQLRLCGSCAFCFSAV